MHWASLAPDHRAKTLRPSGRDRTAGGPRSVFRRDVCKATWGSFSNTAIRPSYRVASQYAKISAVEKQVAAALGRQNLCIRIPHVFSSKVRDDGH